MTHTRIALRPATSSNSPSSRLDSVHSGAGSAVLATLLISNCTEIGVASDSRLIATPYTMARRTYGMSGPTISASQAPASRHPICLPAIRFPLMSSMKH